MSHNFLIFTAVLQLFIIIADTEEEPNLNGVLCRFDSLLRKFLTIFQILVDCSQTPLGCVLCPSPTLSPAGTVSGNSTMPQYVFETTVQPSWSLGVS